MEALFSLNRSPKPYRPSKLSFGPNWVPRTKTSIIFEFSRTLSSNADFSIAHIANFNFTHFEIEESFGLIWVKLQNGQFHL